MSTSIVVNIDVPELTPVGDVAAGLHVTLVGAGSLDDVRLSELCQANGLFAPALSLYALEKVRYRGLVFGYGAIPPQATASTVDQLRKSVAQALGNAGGKPGHSLLANIGR